MKQKGLKKKRNLEEEKPWIYNSEYDFLLIQANEMHIAKDVQSKLQGKSSRFFKNLYS